MKQGLNWWSRNIKWDLLTIISMTFSNKLMLKDWNWRTPITDVLNLEENNLDYNKNCLWRKMFSEKFKSEMCTKWQKLRERKNYESKNALHKNWKYVMRQYKGSLHKCRICKDRWITWTIQGKNQEVESNHSGRLSDVPNQPATIPSSRSMLSRDNRLPLDTWNQSGPPGKTFLVIIFQRLIRPKIIFKEFIFTGSVPVHMGTWTPGARETIPMPTFAGRPSTMSSLLPVGYSTEFYGWTVKTADIGTAIRQSPCTFYILMLEDKSQKTKRLLIVHWMLCCGSSKWRWLIPWTNQNPPN